MKDTSETAGSLIRAFVNKRGGDFLRNGVVGYSEYREGKDLITETMEALIVDAESNPDPADEVKQLNERLASNKIADKGIRDWAIDLIAVIVAPEVGPVLFDIGLSAFNLSVIGSATSTQQAAVAAMQASLSGRVSTRLERYWGLM